MSVVIICCGNTLRGDDGVAARVAAVLREQFDVVEVTQLQPEHADLIRAVDRVAFVDASREGPPGEIRCIKVHPVDPESAFSHHLEPQELLALASTLYGVRPEAVQITISGAEFELREELTPAVQAAVPHVVRQVAEWVRRTARSTTPSPRR